ncbi:MAG: CaiB/BaiF CoA transferase family protein [Tropicimonas sp.]|uniref:CaiB/BaiF CoA transferase family protein n=1 Tax=Tropicimonas sp. TaxID=2067044 RepID=UPI003A859C06
MSGGILSNVRVLDLTRVMSGPFCTSMLADLGAEVIKVELPGAGDEGRSFGPFRDGVSTYFMLLNRNKKSVTIDLKSVEGREILAALIPQCDVLIENFRPGVMARLGLDEPAVRRLNPGIIYTSISGFGQDGPLRDRPAFDLVIQAMSGLMSVTGPQGGPETAVGESVADVCTGMFAAFGTVAALFDRARGGPGRHVDVAMLDSMAAMQLTGLSRELYFDDTPGLVGNRHPVTYPVDSFPATDGTIVLVCFTDVLFVRLMALVGQPELARDPRFATNAARNRNEAELRALIAGWSGARTRDEAVAALLEAGIPAAPVWSLRDLVGSEHAAARGLVVQGHHETLGEVPFVPQPVRFSGSPAPGEMESPELGAQTEVVLRDHAGLSADQIADLAARKVI